MKYQWQTTQAAKSRGAVRLRFWLESHGLTVRWHIFLRTRWGILSRFPKNNLICSLTTSPIRTGVVLIPYLLWTKTWIHLANPLVLSANFTVWAMGWLPLVCLSFKKRNCIPSFIMQSKNLSKKAEYAAKTNKQTNKQKTRSKDALYWFHWFL